MQSMCINHYVAANELGGVNWSNSEKQVKRNTSMLYRSYSHASLAIVLKLVMLKPTRQARNCFTWVGWEGLTPIIKFIHSFFGRGDFANSPNERNKSQQDTLQIHR